VAAVTAAQAARPGQPVKREVITAACPMHNARTMNYDLAALCKRGELHRTTT
jgi:hypothetical protein